MKDRFFEVMMVITGIALVFGAIMFFTSCSGPVKQLAKIQANHPAALAKACADWYPITVVKDSTITKYLKGEVIEGPTVFVTADCPEKDGKRVTIKVPCPPSSTQVDTVYKERFREKESTAKLAVKEAELADTQKKLSDSEKRADRLHGGRNNWRWIALVLMGYCAARIVLRMYTRISLP